MVSKVLKFQKLAVVKAVPDLEVIIYIKDQSGFGGYVGRHTSLVKG